MAKSSDLYLHLPATKLAWMDSSLQRHSFRDNTEFSPPQRSSQGSVGLPSSVKRTINLKINFDPLNSVLQWAKEPSWASGKWLCFYRLSNPSSA